MALCEKAGRASGLRLLLEHVRAQRLAVAAAAEPGCACCASRHAQRVVSGLKRPALRGPACPGRFIQMNLPAHEERRSRAGPATGGMSMHQFQHSREPACPAGTAPGCQAHSTAAPHGWAAVRQHSACSGPWHPFQLLPCTWTRHRTAHVAGLTCPWHGIPVGDLGSATDSDPLSDGTLQRQRRRQSSSTRRKLSSQSTGPRCGQHQPQRQQAGGVHTTCQQSGMSSLNSAQKALLAGYGQPYVYSCAGGQASGPVRCR